MTPVPKTSTPKAMLTVDGLHKKFSAGIRHNMYYGLLDFFANIRGKEPRHYMSLRNEEFWALQNINFKLYEGEILGVVGSNGSGKTTMMRMISNIYSVDKGQIRIPHQYQVTPIFALRAGMQQLFTGRENIYIKGAMYGLTRAEIEEKMEEIIEFSELGKKVDWPFGNYSSGMRSRLAYSIALATDPNIFIIDEALAVGDSVFKAKCFDNLKEFVKQPERAVLFVSNNIKKVLKIANRVIIMDKGQIIHESTDIRAALIFYIRNCLKDLDEQKIQKQLQRVQEYDM